ncbi:MAG: hypothetical protein KKD00_05190, partial [Gammaproteobacteria bacterium]|nr:hypothetical protein [Gammaproteobacteria bacterium]
MSETNLGGSGSGSMLGETKMFDSNVPHDFTNEDGRWLRTGFIETDPAKFDTDFWAESVATYWTDGYSSSTFLTDVAANSSGIVVVTRGGGTGGGILRSTDFGKSWAEITVPGFSAGMFLRCIKWIGSLSLFVAVGDSGRIVTSPDGLNWTTRASGLTTNHLMAFEHNGTVFVAVGTAGEILTSSDAMNWIKRTSGTGQNLQSVCFGNGIWFAGGAANANNSCRSLNQGATWVTVSVDVSTNAGINGAVHDGTQFVLTARSKGIYKSTDAATW